MTDTTPRTITKKALIDRIAEATDQKRSVVRETIQEFLDQVTDELGQGNRLEFRDFGVFEVRERAARMAQNPRTGEPAPVPARRAIKFKAGRKLRDAIEAGMVEDQHPQIRITPAAESVVTDNTPVAASG